MNKVLKRGLIMSGIAVIAYQGMRVFKLAKSSQQLHGPLKEHLTTLFGEEPKLGCTVEANFVINVRVIAKFSAETLEKYPDIKETIQTYIVENYPILNIKRLKVVVCDKSLNSIDLLKQEHPTFYKLFGKTIEKKIMAATRCKECAAEEEEKNSDTTD